MVLVLVLVLVLVFLYWMKLYSSCNISCNSSFSANTECIFCSISWMTLLSLMFSDTRSSTLLSNSKNFSFLLASITWDNLSFSWSKVSIFFCKSSNNYCFSWIVYSYFFLVSCSSVIYSSRYCTLCYNFYLSCWSWSIFYCIWVTYCYCYYYCNFVAWL